MKQRALCAVLALVMVVVGCGGGGDDSASAPAPAAAPPAGPAADAGGVTGSVTYTADDTDGPISMDADPVCAGLHTDEVHSEMIVADDAGNLANVLVYVKDGASGGAAPSEAALIDQEGCIYKPHVVAVMVGQPVKIRNSDATLHNVHALPTKNPEFNQAQPIPNMELEKTFDQAEIIPVKCDVHPWMKSYIGVMEHPYFAVTGTDGSFSIDGLAPGDYVLEAWHEELGTRTANITVAPNETAQASFDFTSS